MIRQEDPGGGPGQPGQSAPKCWNLQRTALSIADHVAISRSMSVDLTYRYPRSRCSAGSTPGSSEPSGQGRAVERPDQPCRNPAPKRCCRRSTASSDPARIRHLPRERPAYAKSAEACRSGAQTTAVAVLAEAFDETCRKLDSILIARFIPLPPPACDHVRRRRP